MKNIQILLFVFAFQFCTSQKPEIIKELNDIHRDNRSSFQIENCNLKIKDARINNMRFEVILNNITLNNTVELSYIRNSYEEYDLWLTSNDSIKVVVLNADEQKTLYNKKSNEIKIGTYATFELCQRVIKLIKDLMEHCTQ